MWIRRHLVETIVKAARVTAIDPALLMAIADKEFELLRPMSRRAPPPRPACSSLSSGTWLQVVRDFGARHGLGEGGGGDPVGRATSSPSRMPAERVRILELRRTRTCRRSSPPRAEAVIRTRISSRSAATNRWRDLPSHFLGPDDAERFMEKVVASRLGRPPCCPSRPRANKPIFSPVSATRKAKSLSVAEVHGKFEADDGACAWTATATCTRWRGRWPTLRPQRAEAGAPSPHHPALGMSTGAIVPIATFRRPASGEAQSHWPEKKRLR